MSFGRLTFGFLFARNWNRNRNRNRHQFLFYASLASSSSSICFQLLLIPPMSAIMTTVVGYSRRLLCVQNILSQSAPFSIVRLRKCWRPNDGSKSTWPNRHWLLLATECRIAADCSERNQLRTYPATCKQLAQLVTVQPPTQCLTLSLSPLLDPTPVSPLQLAIRNSQFICQLNWSAQLLRNTLS